MSDDRDWIDELYAESRDELPPAALDDTVLAAARDSATRPWYRDLRYLATVATAASFVLAAMLVYYAPDDSGFVGSTPAEPVSSKTEASKRRDAASAPAAPADAGLELPLQEAAADIEQPTPDDAPVDASLARASSQRPTTMLDVLISRCGSAPGDLATRTLLEDSLGWYLRVTAADSLTYYRCQEGEWRQIEGPVGESSGSDQQQNAEDDQ